MHNYINFLVRKSDFKKNEFHGYNHKLQKKAHTIKYEKITEPNGSDYIIFDFETTGLSPEDDRIVEIGAVKVINDNIVGEFNELVNPGRVIPPYISEKIHITDEMVSDKRTIEEVLPEFVDFIEDLPLVAHNARFDMGFLIRSLARMGRTCKNPAIDTLYLSRKYLNLERNNLGYIAERFGVELNNAHRAFSDVMALYEIYQIIKNVYKNY